MIVRHVAGLVVAVALVSAPRPVHADGFALDLSDGEKVALLLVGAAYVGITVGMGIKDIHPGNDSRTYGIVEAAFNAPFAAFWGIAAYGDIRDGTTPVFFLGMTGVHTALMSHGIYTAVRSHDPDGVAMPRMREEPSMFRLGRLHGAITPTAFPGGPGLAISGAF